MLTDEERRHITEIEHLKAEIRAEMAGPQSEKRSTVGHILGSENFRWVASSMAIPLAVFLWGQHETYLTEEMRQEVQRREANEREDRLRVETTQRNIDLVIRLLPGLNKDDGHRERLNALAILKALEAKGQLDSELRAAFESNVATLTNAVAADGTARTPAQRQELEVLGQGAPSSADIAENASPAPTLVVPGAKVYVQIFDEEQRALAQQVQEAARKLGIAAPGIENVVVSAAKRNKSAPQRYQQSTLLVFKKSDLSVAQRLAQQVEQDTGAPLTVKSLADQAAFSKVPAGQLEVWLAR